MINNSSSQYILEEYGGQMKQAYLVLAHHQFGLLKKQIALLDDDRNDIFIHIDKKSRNVDFNDIKSVAKSSNVYFTERIAVSWGGFSMVCAELILLESALNHGNYSYYHLLSGVDLPLKTTDEIFSFFEENYGTEFVHFCSDDIALNKNCNLLNRIALYYPFQESHRSLFIKMLSSLCKHIQLALGTNRVYHTDKVFGYGSQWFSITDKLAEYVIKNKNYIFEFFKCSCCSDELFLQSLILNSDFKNRLAQKDLNQEGSTAFKRLIDWKRGSPYVFRMGDYDLLMSSDCFFARKFDENVDPIIIDAIYHTLLNKKGHWENE